VARQRASRSCSPVESRKGAVSLSRPVSPPRSSNRTCGFPASGFPTGFTTVSRRNALPPTVSPSWHAKFAEHRCHRQPPNSPRGHLMVPGEEVTARYQDRAHFLLQTLHAPRGRTGPNEPPAGLPEAMQAKAVPSLPCSVAREVEPLRPRVAQTGLRPVQGQTQPRHRAAGPYQCLLRVSATAVACRELRGPRRGHLLRRACPAAPRLRASRDGHPRSQGG
jgi:hypothetical protein